MKIFLPSVLVAALSAGAVFATSPRDLQEPLMHDDYHHPHVTYTITKTKVVATVTVTETTSSPGQKISTISAHPVTSTVTSGTVTAEVSSFVTETSTIIGDTVTSTETVTRTPPPYCTAHNAESPYGVERKVDSKPDLITTTISATRTHLIKVGPHTIVTPTVTRVIHHTDTVTNTVTSHVRTRVATTTTKSSTIAAPTPPVPHFSLQNILDGPVRDYYLAGGRHLLMDLDSNKANTLTIFNSTAITAGPLYSVSQGVVAQVGLDTSTAPARVALGTFDEPLACKMHPLYCQVTCEAKGGRTYFLHSRGGREVFFGTAEEGQQEGGYQAMVLDVHPVY